jgi:hypothetical protein
MYTGPGSSLWRGGAPSEPLSPIYLFILILELLSSTIKNDPNINGHFLKYWSKTIKFKSTFNE